MPERGQPASPPLTRFHRGRPEPGLRDVALSCCIMMWMKAIQVTFEEELLEQLDRRPEVRERGRSAVLRELTAAYLAEKRSEDIARLYREAYTKFPQTDEELEGWESVQAWPED